MSRAVNDRRFSADEVDSAIAALSEDPDRFEHAQQIVTHAAPSLHLLLGQAMSQGGWHEASEQQAGQIAGLEGDEDRALAIRSLAAEEARLGMLVGVAIGFELSRELHGDGS